MQNQLLKSISAETYRQLEPHVELLSLSQGEVLRMPGEPIHYLYFPEDCLLSIVMLMSEGGSVETGIAGNQDVLGVAAVLHENATIQTQYIVQIPGVARQIPAPVMRRVFEENEEIRGLLLSYVHRFIVNLTQNAACNRLHRLDRRLARWLLEVRVRTNQDEINLTQEFISHMLGVRRAGVTQALQQLQDAELIRCTRGKILILDSAGLVASACECFEATKARQVEGLKILNY